MGGIVIGFVPQRQFVCDLNFGSESFTVRYVRSLLTLARVWIMKRLDILLHTHTHTHNKQKHEMVMKFLSDFFVEFLDFEKKIYFFPGSHSFLSCKCRRSITRKRLGFFLTDQLLDEGGCGWPKKGFDFIELYKIHFFLLGLSDITQNWICQI